MISLLALSITYRSQAVRSCVNILYTIHLPHCPSPSVYLTWFLFFLDDRLPSQNLLPRPSSGIFLRCATLTFLISLLLFNFLCLSFPLSLLCFLSLLLSSKPDQLALDGFLLAPVRPDFTLLSLGLSAGKELGDRSLKGRIPDGR